MVPNGPRDVLILSSRESLQGKDIVPRKTGCLTKEDRDRLTSQGIPEQCWGGDVSLMEARYRREERFEVKVLGCKEELTVERVKEEIRALMNNTEKPGGRQGVQLPRSHIHYPLSIILYSGSMLQWPRQEEHWRLVFL